MRVRSATHAPPIADLPARLEDVADPRDRRARRHRIGTVLPVALCAVLSGARSLRAIGQWAQAAPQHALARLNARVTSPDLGTGVRGVHGSGWDVAG